MPSAKLICLSFIGQSRPQGTVSWFSLPSEKAQALPRAEVSSSAPPLLLQTTDHPGTGLGVGWVIGQWLRWGLCSKPLLPHKLEKEQTSAQCLRSSAVSTAGDGDLLPQKLLPLSPPPAPLLVVMPPSFRCLEDRWEQLRGLQGWGRTTTELAGHHPREAGSGWWWAEGTGMPLSLSHQERSQQPDTGSSPVQASRLPQARAGRNLPAISSPHLSPPPES